MTQEALKLALEALELNNKEWKSLADSGDAGYWKAEDQDHYKQTEEAITAIKEALAQTQEPVAWTLADKVRQDLDRQSCPDAFMRIAVESIVKHHPPQRTWVGLTDKDCKGMSAGDKVVAMWADRTLKEKNNGV